MASEMTDLLNSVVPFASHAGIEVTGVDPDGGAATLHTGAESLNHIGSVHAGAIFTLAETTSGAAMVGIFSDHLATAVPVAASAQITYVAVAHGELSPTAAADAPAAELLEELATSGRVRFSVSVTVVDPSGATVATSKVDWHIRTRGDRP